MAICEIIDLPDTQPSFVSNRIQIDGDGFYIAEARIAVIASPPAVILEIGFVPFKDKGVQGYEICFEHKLITTLAPFLLTVKVLFKVLNP